MGGERTAEQHDSPSVFARLLHSPAELRCSRGGKASSNTGVGCFLRFDFAESISKCSCSKDEQTAVGTAVAPPSIAARGARTHRAKSIQQGSCQAFSSTKPVPADQLPAKQGLPASGKVSAKNKQKTRPKTLGACVCPKLELLKSRMLVPASRCAADRLLGVHGLQGTEWA